MNAFHLTFSRLAINRIISGGMPSPASLGVNIYNATPNFTDLSLTNYFSVGGGSNAARSSFAISGSSRRLGMFRTIRTPSLL